MFNLLVFLAIMNVGLGVVGLTFVPLNIWLVLLNFFAAGLCTATAYENRRRKKNDKL
jgi:hypothetical protein